MTRLFLCEKPSQARDIAKVLNATSKGEGYLNGSGVVVTWCYGHLLELAPPEAYDSALKTWSFDTLPILPGNWRMEVKKNARKQIGVIKKLLKMANEVVIATDADREGELIAREVLSHLRWQGPISRLWLSALDDASIRRALNVILPGRKTEPLYYAGLARSRADWLVGMNLTRLYTLIGRRQGVDGVLSVGRVQTPTLRLVVERDREIESFVPKPFWDVEADCVANNGMQFGAKWIPDENVTDPEGRCINQQAALDVAQAVSGAVGRVTSAETKQVHESPPLPFELAGLQKIASKRWGMSAAKVQELAQSLYETHKATTYPRTDCAYLPTSQFAEATQVLEALQQSDPVFGKMVQKADLTRKSKAWNDKKITAHHAIIPTMEIVDIGRMNPDELKIYDLIRRHYLAQFFPDHVYQQTNIVIRFDEHRFKTSGRVSQLPGWKKIFESVGEGQSEGEKQALPPLSEGGEVRCTEARVLDKQTKPPARYTEGTLTQAMKSVGKTVTDPRLKRVLKETSGIGTVATRAAIIEVLLQRGYIQREKRYVISTAKGRALIDVLPDEVKDPVMTALWEQALEEIAAGKSSLSDFLRRQSDWVRTVVGALRQKTGSSAPNLSEGAAPVHPCPDCAKPMRRRKGSKGYFWGCSGYPDCNTTLPDNRGKPARSSGSKPPTIKTKGKTEVKAGKNCPECGKGRLIVRTIRKGSNTGKTFLGCSGYPNCNYFSWKT